jgi:hypothetical protein
MADYLSMIDKSREEPETAASSAKISSKTKGKHTSGACAKCGKKRGSNLTRMACSCLAVPQRATGKRRSSPKESAAMTKKGRKKRRTAAQKAATAKMIRANKRARRSANRKPAKRKKHRRTKRRSSAREQSYAIVKYDEKRAERNARGASKPARKTRKKSTSMAKRRKSGSRKKHRTAKQRAATRKMIAANRAKHGSPKRHRKGRRRARKSAPIVRRTVLRSAKRSGKRRSKAVVTTTRRRGKKGATVHLKMTGVTERRRRRSRRRNPIKATRRYVRNPIGSRAGYIRNPLMGGKDWALGLSGFILGGMGTVFIDRVVSTHPPTAAATGTAATDQPTVGQIYNVESPSAPIWSSMLRIAVAVASVSVPFGIAAAVKGAGAKSFFQLWGFGAMSATVVKAGTDVVAMLTGKNAFGSRFYAPEVSAQEDLKKASVAGTAALPALPVPMLAGIPQRLQAPVHQIVRSAPVAAPHTVPAPPAMQASPVRSATPAAPPVQTQPTAAPAPTGVGAPAEDDFNPYTAGLDGNQ